MNRIIITTSVQLNNEAVADATKAINIQYGYQDGICYVPTSKEHEEALQRLSCGKLNLTIECDVSRDGKIKVIGLL